MRQQPGERHLAWGRVVAARDLLDDGRSPEIAASDRAPWQERHLLEGAKLQDRLRIPFEKAVPILDRHDGRELLRPLHLVGRYVRQADMPDLALGFQFHKGADGFLEGDLGIRAVKLIDIDLFDPEALQAALTGGAKVLGPAVGFPHAGPWPV